MFLEEEKAKKKKRKRMCCMRNVERSGLGFLCGFKVTGRLTDA